MPQILASELLFRFSTTSGSAGNTLSSNAASSLGKYISTSTWTGGTLNDLFSDLTNTQHVAGTSDYRCLFFLNNTASSVSLQRATISVLNVSNGSDLAIGIDPVGIVAVGSGSAQAATIANGNTAPAGVTFSTSATIGTVAAGYCVGIWVRRSPNSNNGPQTNDGGTITIQGEST